MGGYFNALEKDKDILNRTQIIPTINFFKNMINWAALKLRISLLEDTTKKVKRKKYRARKIICNVYILQRAFIQNSHDFKSMLVIFKMFII